MIIEETKEEVLNENDNNLHGSGKQSVPNPPSSILDDPKVICSDTKTNLEPSHKSSTIQAEDEDLLSASN